MTMSECTDLTVQFVKEDIRKVHAYAVVTGEDPHLAVEGEITESLLKHLPDLRDEREQHQETRRGKKGLRFGTVLVSDVRLSHLTGPTSFRYVLHAVLDSVGANKEYWLSNMRDLYREIFREAEKLRISSLAVPLLGSGMAGRYLATEALTSAIVSCRTHYLTELLVVNNDEHILEYIQENLDSKSCRNLHEDPVKLGGSGGALSERGDTKQAPGRFPVPMKAQLQNKLKLPGTKKLKELREVAQKKGLTMRNAGRETDIFTTLSDQLTSVLGEEMEQGNLRTVIAGYLRRGQSSNDHNVEDFLMEFSLEEVLSSIEQGDYVESQIIISAVCNAMNVEVLLLAASRGEIQEVLFQPFREKEFLPTFVIGTISGEQYISFEQAIVDSNDVPPTWSGSSKDTELVTLLPESAEFQEVQHSFLRSIGCLTYNVIQIKRVQSRIQWNHFKLSLEQMVQKNPDKSCERFLWHGTSETSIKSICKEGFNRSFCGKNAARYGEGTYFSPNSSYAAEDTYSVPDDDGIKYVFRARVLTGRYTKGQSGMKVPPYLNEKDSTRFDSVVDNVDRPNLFVIFHDHKAYPEYLIKFS